MRINGIEVSPEDLEKVEGPSGEEATRRFHKFHRRQKTSFLLYGTGVSPGAQTQERNVQGSFSRYTGDPHKLRKRGMS